MTNGIRKYIITKAVNERKDKKKYVGFIRFSDNAFKN